ncbi:MULTISPECIES: DUF4123 domain-containing protein [unclassified Brenneria]|uniref:DUF4123 domain-containing protein n=1 Tax=unclassified Brenneria TaxID=2634434 RepID=UPI0018F072B9|nr:DUF4123 domain-containing protein [Brenneria sp. L3-3C-1]MBJ7224040.1 DUF4123 domain-containing protein [Brenneria sp. L3-3C-1]MEE3645285.1 DUF4123 domain-containing protein [Brenneria sp. L3_3C_1]
MMTNGYSLFEISQRHALPLYAIIDPLNYPALPEFWRAFQPMAADLWRTLHFDKQAADWQFCAPIVVKIEEGGPGETLLHWLVDTQPAVHRGVILMNSAAPLQPVVDCWQRRIACRWPDGTSALLRSYAPEVLLPWWQTLDDAAKMDFLGPLTSLYLPISDSEHGQYRLLIEQEKGGEANPDYQIQLTRYQFYLLADANRLHRLANELFLFVSTLCLFPLDIEVVKSRFLSGIELAKARYPRATEAECEAWSAHRWVLGSEFFQHPAFIHLTKHHTLGDSIRIFKAEPERIESVHLHYHRPGWMRGELPDTMEVIQ